MIGITRQNDIILKKQLLSTIELIDRQLKLTQQTIKSRKTEDLEKIYVLNSKIKDSNVLSLNTIISIYQMGPLGKDLRRTISYTFINKYLDDISTELLKVIPLIAIIIKDNIEIEFLSVLVKIINQLLNNSKSLIYHENEEFAHKNLSLIKKNNSLYVKYVKTPEVFLDQKVFNEDNDIINLEELKFNYFIFIQSFQQITNVFKELTNSIIYIIHGAY